MIKNINGAWVSLRNACHYLHSMQPRLSWEKNPPFLKPEVSFCSSQQPKSYHYPESHKKTQSHLNLILRSILKLYSYARQSLSSGLLLSGFLSKIMCKTLLSFKCTIRAAQFIRHDLLTRIIFREQQNQEAQQYTFHFYSPLNKRMRWHTKWYLNPLSEHIVV
jgi:hypothetical protein